MADPRISVIVCTCGRPAMLARALESIRAQQIDEPYELIIVDDGGDIAGGDYRVVRPVQHGAGAARAAGFAAAKGALIAWCDDDDTWTPDHLRILRDYLDAHRDVDLAYGDSRWPDGSVPYSIDHDGSLLKDSQYIFASDVMHRAAAAREAGGFDPSLTAFEDWDLWLRMSLRGLLRHVPGVIGTHHVHDGCVAHGDHWQERERVVGDHGARLRAAGLAAQHDMIVSDGRDEPFDPDTWRPGNRQLLWHAIMRANQGYGSVARQLLSALERRGVDITFVPTRNQPFAGFERCYRPLQRAGQIGFYYDYLDRPGVMPCERIVHYTMAESTIVPADEVDEINCAVSLLYVPCAQNVDVFRDCGVRVPIRVLHHGIDPGSFPMLDRPRREVMTFGTFGELSLRKGIDVLVRAFQDEFKPHEPVRLLLKSSSDPARWGITDERIRAISRFMSNRELLELLREMDVFVMPSRGEGFGLCGLEAMATGLPLIATDWSGPADYLDASDSYPLSYELVDARGAEAHGMNFYGRWAQPSYEQLRHLMRQVFEHRDEAAERGRRAAERVHRDWTWDRVAGQMCDDLDQLARQWSAAEAVRS